MTDITIKSIKLWIAKCNSIHSLQSIRAKTNKRIKNIISPKYKSPFVHIPIDQKREVLKVLFTEKELGE
jgi:hypothetical protein